MILFFLENETFLNKPQSSKNIPSLSIDYFYTLPSATGSWRLLVINFRFFVVTVLYL